MSGRGDIVAAVAVLILFLLLGIPGRAEILPTSGTFRGIYDVNRAGVGRIAFFIISKSLNEQMAPYVGKYIEVEVIDARQPINPGPAIVDRIGKVTRLDDAPLKIELRAKPTESGAIDVIYSVVNVGEKEITIDANTLSVGVRGYSQAEPDGAPGDFFKTGYTSRELGFSGSILQRWNFLAAMTPGEPTHFYTREVALRPGESAPFVLHGVQLEPGEYELVAGASFKPSEGETIPVMATRSLDVPLDGGRRVEPGLLEARAQVSSDDEWFVVTGRLLPTSETPVSLFTLPDGERHFLGGLLQLYSDAGDLLPATLEWSRPDGPWRRVQVEREGLPFKFRVRHADHFSQARVTKIGFWTVTEQGIERITLADGFAAPLLAKPEPWGEAERGCRMRIRLPKAPFKTGEKIRFFFQGESDDSEADMLWVDEGKFASQVVVRIDGKKAPIGSTQLSDGHVNMFPFQGEITMQSVPGLVPGKHTLHLSVQGDPGTYTNLRGEDFRKLDGTLVSNVVEFELEP